MTVLDVPSIMNVYSGFNVGSSLVSLAIGILVIIAWWRIFEQAGFQGWKAIIPVYNVIIMFRMTRIRPEWAWVMVGLLIPFVNFLAALGLLVLGALSAVRLSQAYNRSGVWAIGLVLLPFIFYPILAFGYERYDYSRIANEQMI